MNETDRPRAAERMQGYFAHRRARWERIPGNVRGGLWATVAAGFFASMLALIKLAGATLHVTEILVFRQVFMVLLASPVLISGFPGSLWTARPGLQLLRVLAAAGAMLFSFTAVIHLPLADVIAITFSRTFFITVFAIMLLGEIVGARRWWAIAIGFAGVLVAAQPEGVGSLNIYGLMAIVGAACAGLVMVIIRILSRTDRPVTIITYQAVGIGLIMTAPAIWFWKTPTAYEWLLLFGIGAASILSQTCNILAFRAAEASAVAPFDYVRFVYAVIIGIVVFSEWPSLQVLIGAAIIVAAGLYTLERERQAARQARRDAGPPSEGLGGTM